MVPLMIAWGVGVFVAVAVLDGVAVFVGVAGGGTSSAPISYADSNGRESPSMSSVTLAIVTPVFCSAEPVRRCRFVEVVYGTAPTDEIEVLSFVPPELNVLE